MRNQNRSKANTSPFHYARGVWQDCILSPLLLIFIHRYFEKGCRKKCTRQSRKVLWVVLNSLFFKQISKNGTRGHGHMFATAKGKQQW